MILRFALLLLVSTTQAKDGPANCRVRIDILDGGELTEGLRTFFKETQSALSAQDCALTCFHKKCDVAYFHASRHVCQFTSDSASISFSTVSCNRFVAEPAATNNGDADRISRFCVKCSEGSRRINGNSARSLFTKRIKIPLRAEGTNTSIHRSVSRSRKPMKISKVQQQRTPPIQRFVIESPGGNITISRQPMRLKFSGPRLGKAGRSRSKYSDRFFTDNATNKRRGSGIVKKKKR